MKDDRPKLVIVGGFLGAGKTTLILSAARLLARRGLRSAVILNDQGDDLVDTRLVRESGFPAGEVTGGCFCCRFSDLISVADDLRNFSPDVIFAEPVGSCTDISATILQPLRREFLGDYGLAPYTVLVDPAQMLDLRRGDADGDMRFLFDKQIEEADLICFTKLDLSGSFRQDEPQGHWVSAKTGEGVEEWLDIVLSGQLAAGGRILDIDYERYSQAEAALAWLNCAATLETEPAISSALLLGPLVDGIQKELGEAGFQIAHLKAIDDSSSGFLKAAITRNDQEPIVEGALDASPAAAHGLWINLRVVGEPDRVKAVVQSELEKLPGKLSVQRMVCFRPAPPKPERRMSAIS